MDMDELLNNIYKKKLIKNKTNFPEHIGNSVYGEIEKAGTEKILEMFSEYFNSNAVFCDIGSGNGKMVLHVGLVTKVKESIGIEYSKERYDASLELKETYAPNSNHITFYNQPFQNVDLKNVTIAYVDNTMFKRVINNQIFDAIPKGCLLLYKKTIPAAKNQKIYVGKGLIKRTYNQAGLNWLIKE
jgi:tRNA G46 methylase TrmB